MQPIVSVCIISYNHEKYIAQTIESALMQNTNFDFEIVVGEDCSMDSTRNIVMEYANKYPSKINALLNETNLGMMRNFIQTLKSCQGKYVAILEGDDFWIDPDKLQKQVDCLQSNSDFGMVCTDYHKYYQTQKRYKKNCFNIPRYKDTVSFDDYILDRSSIGTATTIFRSDVFMQYLKDIPEDARNSWNVGDTPLWLYISLNSQIKVMPDVTAVYRILDNSACHYETPRERYEFRKTGFDVPFFFIEYYGAIEKTRNLINAKFLRNELLYHSEILQHTESRKYFNEIKALGALKIADYIFLFASVNKVTNRLAKVFLSSISKIKNG